MYCSCNGGNRRTQCSGCSRCKCNCNCNNNCNMQDTCNRYDPQEVARAAEFVAAAARAFAQNAGDYRERIRESNCARQMVRCMQGNGSCDC